ncbi:MAG: LytTR family transcriptional regulator [Clostridia bacterium]|nr:LytTR family transcriptional regulator [Clostridia bacterium]
MRFKLLIDPDREEEIVAVVHHRSELTDQIEALVTRQTLPDRLIGYGEEIMKPLPFDQVECITVIDGKVCAIDQAGRQWRLKQRLAEIETRLPAHFIRINKSAIANERAIAAFTAAFNGAVDATFRCGHVEYVSRRCFAVIKRRYEE